MENDPSKVWDVVEKVGVAMVITRDGDLLEGRPLQARPDADAGVIHFLTDGHTVLKQIAADPRVMLSFADKGGQNYASIDGVATIANDRAKIKELWTPWAKAFWDSPDDPAIRVVTFQPEHARYWDAPNAAVTTIVMLASALVGKKPELGSSGEVNL
jgi:general stress protein 26